MKKILFLGLAAAALASCSQDEALEVVAPEAIGFSNAFVNNATRAIDGTLNSNTLADFMVYGNTKGDEQNADIVPIYSGQTVTKTTTTGDGGVAITTWGYEDKYTQYWIAGNTYNFAAVKNGTVASLVNGLPATISYDATGQNDLLYAEATATGKASNNLAVAFTFDHLLSKAMFTVNNTMAKNDQNSIYFYCVSDVKITNAYKAGTYYVVEDAEKDIDAGSWVPTTGNGSTLEVNFGHVVADDQANNLASLIGMNSSETSKYQQLLIPAEYGESNKLNITCKIETIIDTGGDIDERYHVVDVQNYRKDIEYTFEKGNAYNFVINLGNPGEKIEFTVTKVNDWNPLVDGKTDETDVTL